MNKTSCSTALFAISLVFVLARCGNKPSSGHVLDEALQAGRDSKSFPAADEDYFHDMDRGVPEVPLSPDEVKGRNNWIVWTGGNDRFWDVISVSSFGSFDLLKTISSNPKLKFKRSNRFYTLGLINEPCFDEPTGPDPQRYGLWLDKRRPNCGPDDPFANGTKYPGVAIGARGKNIPVGSYYGEPTGIVGLRLFPNPNFDPVAEKNGTQSVTMRIQRTISQKTW
jgi:hypothetical protein